MGLTFRHGEYARFVRIGGRTVKDGEAVVVWNNHGISLEIIGPKRISLWFSTIRFLSRFKAEYHQYLAVKYRNGSVKHIAGPISMYLNPTVHDYIGVRDGMKLESKDDCLVVFSSHRNDNHDNRSTEKVPTSERRVVYGPTVHFVAPNETIHQFQWNHLSSDLEHPNSQLDKFQILSTSKTHLWRVRCPVKMADLDIIHVDLAISYKIASVEKCLAAHNPIELIQPALMHDAQHCSGKGEDICTWIVQESTFPTFCETMAAVGFHLERIQVLHVEASSLVSKQTAIKEERAAQSKDLSQVEQQVNAARRINETKLEYLKSLNDMGVDVTKVLCASGGHVGWASDDGLPAKRIAGWRKKEKHVSPQSVDSAE
jgi:hypothetical protein